MDSNFKIFPNVLVGTMATIAAGDPAQRDPENDGLLTGDPVTQAVFSVESEPEPPTKPPQSKKNSNFIPLILFLITIIVAIIVLVVVYEKEKKKDNDASKTGDRPNIIFIVIIPPFLLSNPITQQSID